MHDHIFVKGARENNLKNIDVEIPRDKLVVLTGISGSGKSSLAFDTIYAEGQRRYVESLSAYARPIPGPDGKARCGLHRGAFSRHLHRPEDDEPEPALHRRDGNGNLRLFAPSVGAHRRTHCPSCGKEIKQQTIDQIIDQGHDAAAGLPHSGPRARCACA